MGWNPVDIGSGRHQDPYRRLIIDALCDSDEESQYAEMWSSNFPTTYNLQHPWKIQQRCSSLKDLFQCQRTLYIKLISKYGQL